MRDRNQAPADTLTVIAVAIVVYALATIVHEGVGHGGACLLTRCRPELLTSMQFRGDDHGLSNASIRFIAAGEVRVSQANRIALVAYVAGAVLSVVAGLFEPGGAIVVVISGAAASLGGTSGLAWGPQLLHDATFAPETDAPLTLTRHRGWIVAGAIVLIAFVFVLGPGITLRHPAG